MNDDGENGIEGLMMMVTFSLMRVFGGYTITMTMKMVLIMKMIWTGWTMMVTATSTKICGRT